MIYKILFLVLAVSLWWGLFYLTEKPNPIPQAPQQDLPIPPVSLQPAYEDTVIIDEPLDPYFDFSWDDSYQKYVSPDISFQNMEYQPQDLELFWGDFILDSKGGQMLRAEAVKQLQILWEAFYEEFAQKLVIISAYRSYEYQKGIKQRWCSDLYCAKAWHSEHQSWLAFDMFEATNQEIFLWKNHLKSYFEWMSENAHLYGFHNTYQKGREIDGYVVEPWHWRYVGQDLAKLLFESKMTLGEYFNFWKIENEEK